MNLARKKAHAACVRTEALEKKRRRAALRSNYLILCAGLLFMAPPLLSTKSMSEWRGNGGKFSPTTGWIEFTVGLSFVVAFVYNRWWLKKNPPNQAPEPTPTSVTPPAGQEARQP
jgi:hypothetical protein